MNPTDALWMDGNRWSLAGWFIESLRKQVVCRKVVILDQACAARAIRDIRKTFDESTSKSAIMQQCGACIKSPAQGHSLLSQFCIRGMGEKVNTPD